MARVSKHSYYLGERGDINNAYSIISLEFVGMGFLPHTFSHHDIWSEVISMKYLFPPILLILLLSLLGCGASPDAPNPCLTPSFHCSGGFYSLQSPDTINSFSFEKWEPRLSPSEDVNPNATARRFRRQKELGNFTILSMGYKTPTRIPNGIHGQEYAQFLEVYTPAIEQGFVDYLNVGEETDWDVVIIQEDLRRRFPYQKLGSWPGRPADLVTSSDFYIFDDYQATTRQEFDFLLQTGKPVILILNATPGLANINNSYFQLEMARELDLPIMFFAVSERNSVWDYFVEGETKGQFLPYYQFIKDSVKLQDKKPSSFHETFR